MTTIALAPLLSAVLGTLAGGIGVTVAFSVAVLGVARFSDMRRMGHSGASAAYGALAAAAVLVALAIVALGLVLVTSK
jgi:hypothetical protein